MKHLETAIEIAREVGQIQLEGLGKIHQVEYKGKANIVTEIDKKCEKHIFDRLMKAFPTHDVLAEEGNNKKSASDYKWIIDPLDGTVNYAHSYPLFSVSIALEYKNEVILGVVYEPNRKELYTAEKGSGSTLNGRRIKVSEESKLERSLLDTGFAYNIHEGEVENNVSHFVNFLLKARAIRRDGCASSDLCNVACGRFDGFWELYLSPWDIAAGQLIITEAGGKVSSFNGSPLDIYGKEILVSNGKIHDQMIEVLKEGKNKN